MSGIRRLRARVTSAVDRIAPRPAPPGTRYATAEDVPPLMRDWFGGRSAFAPAGVSFECAPDVLEELRDTGPDPRWPIPWQPGGGWSAMTGVPVLLRADLPAARWRLTAPVTSSPASLIPDTIVIREGTTADGKPTALDREYWLVPFNVAISISPEFAEHGEAAARRQLEGFVHACGHDLDPAHIRISRRPPEEPWWNWTFWAEVTVPREPVRYPRECGDWRCPDPAHWAQANPVDEPAVFAGAVTEKRYVDRLQSVTGLPPGWGTWSPPGVPDLLDEALAGRRGQADGKPLWTIDVRPTMGGSS